jgi:AsmA protein
MTEPKSTPRRWPRILAAVLLLLVLAGVAAAFSLDQFLTSAARDQAARLAVAWRRPVEIGAVRITVLAGLGIRVEGVRIGAAAGEERPLLQLDRAKVRLELLRAIRSGGQEIRVRSVELQGLRVAVVRLKDGSTNLQRLADATASGDQASKSVSAGAGRAEERPADRSRLLIEHLSVTGARIAFLDQASGSREFLVDQLDLVVDGLAAGEPLELTLRAGLLSTKQNLELKVHAPALPATLIPVPDRLTLKVAPVDLTPLAAFAPRSVGFQGGRFSADLDVALGAAVPNGVGPTAVRGGFSATGLRFAGQGGGKALDVTLEADLTADAGRGDLSIARLRLAVGPAVLEGQGKVTGLRSERPAVEGLRVVSRNLDLAALAAYYPPLPKLLGGTIAGPIALSLEATGTVGRPAVELRADLTPVRIAFAGQVEKAAGGRLSLAARLRGGDGGALHFDLEGDLAGLDLRPGGTLAKKPGERFSLAAVGSRTVTGEAGVLEIQSFSMALLDMKLEAHGTIATTPGARRLDLAVAIDRVDADRLLLPSPTLAAAAAAGPAPGKPAPAAARGTASPFEGLSGRCTLVVGEAMARRQRSTDLRATVTVKADQVTFEEGRISIWDGSLDFAGTQAQLAPADRPFTVSARAERIQAAGALAVWSDQKVISGLLDAEVHLAGKGETVGAIMRALDGTIEGKLVDGVFLGTDLIAEISGPLAKAVPALKRKAPLGGTTSLGKLVPFSLRIQGGRALLQKPLQVEERDVTATVRGSVGLDGELDMPVALALRPAAVAELSGGRARLQEPLPFTFTLEGKAWSPRIARLDVAPAAKMVAGSLGIQALGKALGLGAPTETGKGPAGETGGQAAGKSDDAKKQLEQDAKKALRKLFGR